MSDFDSIYGSPYFAATDVKGSMMTAVIERVEIAQFKRPNEPTKEKAVLYFVEDLKPLICNQTNARTLATAFGRDFSDWVNKRVRFAAEPTTLGPGVRVYPATTRATSAKPRPAAPPTPDDNGPPAGFDDIPLPDAAE